MRIEAFDYELPDELIALRPASPRSSSRLLISTSAFIRDSTALHLGKQLKRGDRLVVNNTRVLPVHFAGVRVRQSPAQESASRAGISFNLDAELSPGTWRALAKPMRRLKPGDRIELPDGGAATVIEVSGRYCTLVFDTHKRSVAKLLDEHGAPPLPPYITARRATDRRDRHDYQTVFASRDGAAAAPTASLHFDDLLLRRLHEIGVEITTVTLNVGSGTFAPIATDDVCNHVMHEEWGEISPRAAREINATLASDGRVIAVGTTAMRLIESAARGERIRPWQGPTSLYIRPGFRFRVASALLTNFHLPRSSLLVLVAAFVGLRRMHSVYGHAVEKRYRFLSYGDWSLLFP